MFIVSSIPHTSVRNRVITENGMRRLGNVNFSKDNEPVNLRHVSRIGTSWEDYREFKLYQISFAYPKSNTYYWYYENKDDRDTDYGKIIRLNPIGLFCDLGSL